MSDIWVKMNRKDAENWERNRYELVDDSDSAAVIKRLREEMESCSRISAAIRSALDAKVEPIEVQRWAFWRGPFPDVEQKKYGNWVRYDDVSHLLEELAERRVGDSVTEDSSCTAWRCTVQKSAWRKCAEMPLPPKAPEPSAWIKTADRPPTEEDADEYKQVIGLPVGGIYWERISWYTVCNEKNIYLHWQRVPDCLKAPEK